MKRILALLFTALILTQTAGWLPARAGDTAAETRRATGLLKDVRYASGSGSETISLVLNNYTDYSAMRLTEPDRIVIDVFNAAISGKAQTVKAGGKFVQSVRYAQFDTYTARIVLDVEGQPDYTVEKTFDGLQIHVGTVPDGETAEEGQDNLPDTGAVVGNVENKAKKQTISIHKSFSIEYLPARTSDEVVINLASYKGYNVTRLTGPDRLLIDIPKVSYKGAAKNVSIGSPFIKALRYAAYGKDTARIVLDLTGQNQYVVKESKGKLTIGFSAASYRNIWYHNNGDRVYFLLFGAKLTDGGEKQKKQYITAYDKTGKIYTLTFPSSRADLGSGVFRVSDDYVDNIVISKNEKTGQTSLKITAGKKFSYEIFTRDGGNGTTITMLTPAAKKDKLVVIDAGHGGSAPGAIYKGLYEKDLNLDIALRLNELLKKKKVKTYMIREDDSYVGNYERAFIANTLKASLFLSIHNNAIDDPDYSGTMTLYYPQPAGASGFTGKSFAAIIHEKLLGSLGTVNRKTIVRPNLVVLNATAMPSALAEVAFMTNAKDRANLQKESFRQKAAQALCDAVVQALTKIK